jgi:hypothetical protein
MNLSVLIGTCDQYSVLWEAFTKNFNKYWPHPTENIFVSETLEVPNITETNFKTVTPGKLAWGERMLQGINACPTDYIFFILEDYFLKYVYSNDQINYYIKMMEQHNMDRLQISPGGNQTYEPCDINGLEKLSANSGFLITMQPSIWSKKHLNQTLDPRYSPHDFELKGSKKLLSTNHNIYIDRSIKDPYFNAVRIGLKKSKGWEEFFKSENLEEPGI